MEGWYISELDVKGAETQPVSCGMCWYACRGEHQTKMTPARVMELIR